VKHLEQLEFSPRLTFFVGENGSGKSTLIEAIALKCGFEGAGGTRDFSNAQHETESNLHQFLRLARGARRERNSSFLRAETMFNVATAAENFGAYGADELHQMSHGEAFLSLAMNRFRPSGLYIMDEPEAALSPQRQLALMGRMHQITRAFLMNPERMLKRLFDDVDREDDG
jgi:predicted ATPase